MEIAGVEWMLRRVPVQDSQPGEVDLHGLYIKEAIRYTDKSIQEAQARGDTKIRFITGTCLQLRAHVNVC